MGTVYDKFSDLIYAATHKERHAAFRSPEFQAVWGLVVKASQNSREIAVLEMRYGGDKIIPLQAVGLSLTPPVTPVRVRQIELKAIRRMRPSISRLCYDKALSDLMASGRYNRQSLRVREYLNSLASLDVS